jgi:sodium-dependent dicarboxylate transporter 2/3/5
MGQGNNALGSKTTSYYVWMCVSVVFMFLFGKMVKPGAGITSMGMNVIGIFCGVLIATIATNEIFWPAVLGLFAMVVCGFSKADNLLAMWFGNSTIQQIIWVMAFTGAVTESGAINVLARQILSIKRLQGHPMRLALTIFFAVLICSALVSSPTAMLLLWYPILDGICDNCGVKKDSDLKRQMLLGVYISAMGAYVLPFKGVHLSSIAIISGIMDANHLEFDNGVYLFTATLIIVLFVLGYALFMRFVWKTDMTPFEAFKFEDLKMKEEDLRMTGRQKILFGFMLFGVLFLISSLLFPKGSLLMRIYTKIGTTWVWVFLFVVLCMMRDKDGKPFINGTKLLQTKTMWNIVAAAGCFTILGRAIASDDYGIKAAISHVLVPVLGNASWPIMVLFCVIISTVFTNFTNGMPVSFTINAICIPIACKLQLVGGGNATVLGTVTILSGLCAFLTNGAIAYAPILLGREEMTNKFIWTKGVVTNLIFIVIASVIGILFGYMF